MATITKKGDVEKRIHCKRDRREKQFAKRVRTKTATIDTTAPQTKPALSGNL